MRPTSSRATLPGPGIVDIENAGSLSAAFTLTRGTPTDSDTGNRLSDKLNLVVRDCGAFDGATAPAAAPAARSTAARSRHERADALGKFDGGEQHRFRFDVALDGSAGNAHQGDSSTVAFTWDAA